MPNAGFTGCRSGGAGTLDPWGLGPRGSTGTRTAPGLATTDQVTSTGRTLWSAADRAGLRSVGAAQFYRGNGPNRGGIIWENRFALGASLANTRCFVGLAAVDTYLVQTANPSAQGTVPMIGIGFDDTSGASDDYRLFHSDGGGVVTSTQIAGLERSTSLWTNVRISALPNGSGFLVEITRREADGTLTEISETVTANIPSQTALLYSQAAVEGTGVAASAQITMAEFEARALPVSSSLVVDRDVVLRTWFGLGDDGGNDDSWGTTDPTGSGTSSVGALSAASYLQSRPRTNRTTTSTSQIAGWRTSNQARVWRGDAAGRGGFDITMLLGFENHLASVRSFFGLSDATDFLANSGDISGLTGRQFIGFGWDSTEATDANLRLCVNDGSAGVVYSDVGIPRDPASVLRVRFSCAPNASAIDVELEDLTNDLSYAASISSNLPLAATFLHHDIGARGATGQIASLIGCWARRVI